jgi:hypothetical protein
MKITVYVSIGLVGCRKEETTEIEDEDLDGLSDADRERLLDDIAHDCVMSMIEYGWRLSDE